MDCRVARHFGAGFQIPAGAEVTVRAVQHGHARGVVLIEIDKRLVQRLRRDTVDGVAHIRPHQRDHGHIALLFQLNRHPQSP